MISGLGASPAAFVPPFQSASARAGGGAGVPAPGLQGETTGTQGGVQGLLNSAQAPARVQGLSSANKDGGQGELNTEDQQKVKDLKARETEVRAHEAAHSAAGGSLTGGVSFQYTTGPDGKSYIAGGEVSIDSSAVGNDPEATIRKMDQVIRAATAPTDPSAQDRQVAAQAQQTRTQAISEAIALAADEKDGQSGRTGALSEAAAQSTEESGGTSEEAGLQALLSQAIEAYQAPQQTTEARAALTDPFSEALTKSSLTRAAQDEEETSEAPGPQNLLSQAIDAYREPRGFARQADLSV
ncbi:MAG: hypothetical protein COA62_12580 [Rhodobiaceae bacterium]|nr:MAG: hypothetical protein COA62_12580 [Rhodobiaceae bacterium]